MAVEFGTSYEHYDKLLLRQTPFPKYVFGSIVVTALHWIVCHNHITVWLQYVLSACYCFEQWPMVISKLQKVYLHRTGRT
jgi:hypothetical protein